MISALAVLLGLFVLVLFKKGRFRAATRLFVVVVVVVIGSRFFGGVAQSPSRAPLVFVALGDSYASGEGIGKYDPATDRLVYEDVARPRNMCHRSATAYPELLALWLNGGGNSTMLRNTTCSGATSMDLIERGQFADAPPQLDQLDASVGLVTLQIGGNDLGFGAAIARCVDVKVIHANPPCASDVTQLVEANAPTLVSHLDWILGTIRDRAPNAVIVVVGYPELFELDEVGTGSRARCGHVRRDDVVALIAMNKRLNQLLAEAAARASVTFAALAPTFVHHGLCGSAQDWVRSIDLALPRPGEPSFWSSIVSRESFHPNGDGHRAAAAMLESVRAIEALR